jgi:UDP-N-acetylglucosamine--N-acetylmuramyl-(pentapeptide) pyrophosphoryl-undecaprenol N-acetylglucosamine transferase
MPDAPLIVFAGGGTGGHLFPAMAVAKQLCAQNPGTRIHFWATTRPIDEKVTAIGGYTLHKQTVQPFPGKSIVRWPNFLIKWRESVRRCLAAFQTDRPAVVVGAGGYAAGPPAAAAHQLDVPVALLNPDLIPGRANLHLAKYARAIFVQWADSARYFPPSAPVEVTGCPIREEFLATDRQAGIARFGLDPAKRTLLVTGASQGARTVNDAILRVWPKLAPPDWQLLHLTGHADHTRVQAAYQTAHLDAKTIAYTDHMADALAAADLVLSRSGASTLAELTALAKPSILMPYPYHKDQHQHANAQVLQSAGAARICIDRIDPAANAALLEPLLAELLKSPAQLAAMSAAAKTLAPPHPAQRIADRLLAIANA